ncbi:MAG: putative iron-sulfur cluster-binding metallochaperone [Nannocystales bacterium]
MEAPVTTCPACGSRGRRVADATVENLVKGDHAAALAGRALFCSSGTCEVVYFEPGGVVVPKADVRVPVFQKETDPARPVCYCFDHSVEDVVAAKRADGSNAIVESITAACRAGLDRCEETSPQGRCCLGNVRAVAKAPPQAKTSPSCCGDSP